MNITYRQHAYDVPLSALVNRALGVYAIVDISTDPARKMLHGIRVPNMTAMDYTCAEPPPVTCTTLTIWRPVIELPITELGHYREGQKGYPGVSLTMSNVLLVLSMPDETELANVA